MGIQSVYLVSVRVQGPEPGRPRAEQKRLWTTLRGVLMSGPRFDKALDLINQMAANLGIGPTRNRSPFLYYEPPKDWGRTVYLFAYTPWRTTDPETGKTGFFALKYRKLKNGSLKLVKSVRFGRRKIADKRCHQWHEKYYRG